MTNREIYEANKEDILNLRRNCVMVKDIAKMYGITSEYSLSGFIVRDGVKLRNPLSDKDVSEIIKRYEDGESTESICKDFHVTQAKIPEILKENGIHIRNNSESKRIYSLDENYFDEIDTQDKAYIIGFLLADGNVTKGCGEISISLQ